MQVINAYPAHNYGVLSQECIARVRSEFEKMPKANRIRFNDRLVGYYGFNDSSSSAITLSISSTNVSLPMLNYTNLLLLDASLTGLETIDGIGNATFPSLRFFNLSFNALTNLKSQIFGHLREIEILDLSHNCFVKFHADNLFLNHENLKKLYLNDNLLHMIQFSLSEPRTLKLDYFDISKNFLEDFSNFEIVISHLNLRNNLISNLIVFHADNMILDAQHNKLTHIITPRGHFKSLNLSHNEFKYMSSVEISEANVLDLSHNQLELWSNDDVTDEYSDWNDNEMDSDDDVQEFPPFGNDLMKQALARKVGFKVQILDLSWNNISSVNELRHFIDCLVINLEGNKLQHIDPEDFRVHFQKLQRVNLRNNPLTVVAEHDLRFYNTTRLLRLHFDYGTTTMAPITSTFLPPLPILFPAIRTSTMINRIEAKTTHSPSSTSSHYPPAASTTNRATVIDEDDKSTPVWVFAVVFAAIIVSSITYLTYRKRQQQGARLVGRSYNEAENYL